MMPKTCKNRKGISLPINTLVIVAIAVIILLAVAAFFMGVWTPSSGGMQELAAKNQACGQLMNIGCADAEAWQLQQIPFNYDYDGSGTTTDDNLLGYCKKIYPSLSGEELLTACKKICGCQIGGGGGVTLSCADVGGTCMDDETTCTEGGGEVVNYPCDDPTKVCCKS